jgi:hypothetical protein
MGATPHTVALDHPTPTGFRLKAKGCPSPTRATLERFNNVHQLQRSCVSLVGEGHRVLTATREGLVRLAHPFARVCPKACVLGFNHSLVASPFCMATGQGCYWVTRSDAGAGNTHGVAAPFPMGVRTFPGSGSNTLNWVPNSQKSSPTFFDGCPPRHTSRPLFGDGRSPCEAS